jgi:hypothetical protein
MHANQAPRTGTPIGLSQPGWPQPFEPSRNRTAGSPALNSQPVRGRVNRETKWTFASDHGHVAALTGDCLMYRSFLVLLAIVLVAVAPVWGYSSNWSFGPFLAVLFLLAMNLINFFCKDPLTLGGADQQQH